MVQWALKRRVINPGAGTDLLYGLMNSAMSVSWAVLVRAQLFWMISGVIARPRINGPGRKAITPRIKMVYMAFRAARPRPINQGREGIRHTGSILQVIFGYLG